MPSHLRSSIAWRSAPALMRGPSRSSILRMIFQPRWRARSQLTKNVRALPRWRAPVGDGARRVTDNNQILLESRRFLFAGRDGGDHAFQKLAILFEFIEREAQEGDLIHTDIILVDWLISDDGPLHQRRVLRRCGLERALLVDLEFADGAHLIPEINIFGCRFGGRFEGVHDRFGKRTAAAEHQVNDAVGLWTVRDRTLEDSDCAVSNIPAIGDADLQRIIDEMKSLIESQGLGTIVRFGRFLRCRWS